MDSRADIAFINKRQTALFLNVFYNRFTPSFFRSILVVLFHEHVRFNKTHNENLSLTSTRTHTHTHTHTHTNTQHSSLLIALCSPPSTQLHGQIEAALIFLHFFLPTLLFFCNSKLYSGSHSGGQLTPRYFGYNRPYSKLYEHSRW